MFSGNNVSLDLVKNAKAVISEEIFMKEEGVVCLSTKQGKIFIGVIDSSHISKISELILNFKKTGKIDSSVSVEIENTGPIVALKI